MRSEKMYRKEKKTCDEMKYIFGKVVKKGVENRLKICWHFQR